MIIIAFIISPIFAAIAFTIPLSYNIMHRPDIIYIPVLFESLYFGVGYVAFGIINAMIIVPLCIGVTSLTLNRLAGLVLAIAVAASGTYLIYAVGFFGYRASIIHHSYFLGAFLPLFLEAAFSFFFIWKDRRSSLKDHKGRQNHRFKEAKNSMA